MRISHSNTSSLDEDLEQGLVYGLVLPSSREEFMKTCCAWLTDAMRAAGVLHTFQSVVHAYPVTDPSMSQRLDCDVFLMSVVYEPGNAAVFLPRLLYIRMQLSSSQPPTSASALINEINVYRLLEPKLPVTIPSYCFGDVCKASGKFFLATECVPGVHVDLFSFNDGDDFESFNDKDINHCRALVRAGAQMTESYNRGDYGSLDFIKSNFEDATWSLSKQTMNRATTEFFGAVFVRTICALQRILLGPAKEALPVDLTTPEAMKLFRYAVAASSKHQETLWWYLNVPEHVGFAFDELRGSIVVCDDEFHLRSCEFSSVSKSSFGLKLWLWIGSLPPDVLHSHLDELLAIFLGALSGALDVQDLRRLLIVACVARLPSLLGELSTFILRQPDTICDAIRRAQETHSMRQTTLEKHVGNLLNTISLLVRSRGKSALDYAITLTSHFSGLPDIVVTPTAQYMSCQIGRSHTLISERADDEFPLVCVFPIGTPVTIAGLELESGSKVQVINPVTGWVFSDSLVAWPLLDTPDVELPPGARMCNFKEPSVVTNDTWQHHYCRFIIFECLRHCRDCFVMHDSRGFCGLSAMYLLRGLEAALELHAADSQNYGTTFSPWKTWRIVSGSFFANTERRKWETHSYLVCDDDGSIADATADQFGIQYPQIWWPADPTYYSPHPAAGNESTHSK